jgi:serine/threonine protein kinase
LGPGEQLGPYRVDAWIGSGGMGDVYRDTDVRLHRTVALKVSAAELSERFEREARIVAALNHPNICQLYDIGPHMLIMEYVVGAPVVLTGRGPLARAEVLKLALQMAAAIEAAHAMGIVHRDLKPANILVTTEGVVKLLDFGIAKQNPAMGMQSRTANATVAGLFMGTPAYTSPEVAEGRAADVRSDIFSFGAVLYEMLSGKRAFPGESVASTLGAVMHRDPDPLRVPPALATITSKCLAKSPEDRFQSATELRVALEKAATRRDRTLLMWLMIAGAGALTLVGVFLSAQRLYHSDSNAINAIAVLPLAIQSNEPEADYICDGIADSITNRLTRISGLKVIPNTIAQEYRKDAADFPKLVKELGIDAVLSGRVVQRGDDLTINIELDDVRHGRRLWGQQYTRKVASC